MDSRKVQITGGGTYFVTLPKEWANRMGIERGVELSLVENKTGSLLLVPEGIRSKNHIRLSIGGKDRLWIERAVISCYVTGFDVIEIDGARIAPEQRGAVREIAQSLVGLEIMDETQDRIVLHCLVSMRDFTVEATLRRILAISRAMLHDAVQAVVTRDLDLAKDVIDRDTEADRLTLVLSRELGLLLRDLLLEEEIGMSRILFHEYHSAAKILERVGDHAVKISQFVLSLDEDLPKAVCEEIRSLYEVASGVIAQSIEAFMTPDLDLADKVLQERGRTASWEQRAQRARERADVQGLATVFDSLLRVRDYAFNIAENALNMGVPLLQPGQAGLPR
jgi:phosphate uptake regulator